MKTNCSYTFNTDVVSQTRTLPDTYSRRSHAFVYLSAQSFPFDLFFTPLLAHLLMNACIIHLNPPIHPFIPSARPSVHLFTTYACHTYPQLIIYRFCIHKNKLFGSTIGLLSHACLLARLLAYAHLLIPP